MFTFKAIVAGIASLTLIGTCAAAANNGCSTTTKTITSSKISTVWKTVTSSPVTKTVTSTCPKSTTNTVTLSPTTKTVTFTSTCPTSTATTVTVTQTLSSTCSTPSPTNTNCFTYNANFDDIVTSNPTGPTEEIRVYDSLYFTLGLNTHVEGTTGIVPRSQANSAAFGLTSNVIFGTPGLSVQYDGSTIEYFNLYYFFFGCAVATQEGVIGVASACTITATGYDINGQTIAESTFEFDSDGAATAQMAPAILPSTFQNNNLYNVTLAFADPLQAATLAALVDSFLYTVCGTGGIPGNS